MAALLTDRAGLVHNVPRLRDVRTSIDCSARLGVNSRWTGDHDVELHAAKMTSQRRHTIWSRRCAPRSWCWARCSRATGRARVSTPGGCAIGARPVNLHIAGIRVFGARIQMRHGYVEAHAEQLGGARVWLDSPSVGATENIMMAAVRARGRTSIENAAREPEVQDLARMLSTMGARIAGRRQPCDRDRGRRSPCGVEHTVIPDRIEAGSLMIAAAMTGGDVVVRGAPVGHLEAVIAKLREIGVTVESVADGLRVARGAALPAGRTRARSPIRDFPPICRPR